MPIGPLRRKEKKHGKHDKKDHKPKKRRGPLDMAPGPRP